MNLIKANFDRRLSLPGVARPVQRPVDIDRTRTGFANLRSLRIYRFEAGSVIDGHAEEDEVFISVLNGAVQFVMSEDSSVSDARPLTLSAPDDSHHGPCVAYLPPNGAYKLIPKSDADVAYARSTPKGRCRGPAVFEASRQGVSDVTVLLEEMKYAERLRLRLVQIDAVDRDVEIEPLNACEVKSEALIHVRSTPGPPAAMASKANAESIRLESWDTVAVASGERSRLCATKGTTALVLVVFVEETTEQRITG